MDRIALLIPTTSRNQIINTPLDLPFFKWLLPTLLSSLTDEEKQKYSIGVFLGFDDNDFLYNNPMVFNNILAEFKNTTMDTKLSLKLVKCSETNHNPVKVWNILHKIAFDEGFDYFYQLGDDIQFLSGGWVTQFIKLLSNNIGIIGGYDINPSRPKDLITQSFTNRKHMEIFGYYYPEIFTNWYSDNWIQRVYEEKSIFASDIKIKNAGGNPKYSINNRSDVLENEIMIGKEKIKKYLENNNSTT